MIRRRADDAGFTIVESLMAIVIVAIIFISLTTGLQLTIRHQADQRTRQQAGTIALEEIEAARSVPWEALELSTTPPAGTPHTDGVVVFGADFDLATDETLVVGPGIDAVPGLLEPASVGGLVLDNQAFDVYRYVTDSGTDVRRVIVEVQWASRGVARSFWTSTQIAEVGAP